MAPSYALDPWSDDSLDTPLTSDTLSDWLYSPYSTSPGSASSGTPTGDTPQDTTLQANPAPQPPAPQPPAPQPPAPVPTGVQGGIDWSTFDPMKGVNDTGVLGVTGKTFTVKTATGKEMKVFEPDPFANQPAAVRVVAGIDLTTNCFGSCIGTTGIIGSDAKTHNFVIQDPASVVTLIKEQYQPRTADQAKADLAAGKKVVFVFVDGQGRPIHASTASTVAVAPGGALDTAASKATTKNGWRAPAANQTINAQFTTYPTAVGVISIIPK